MRSLDPCEVIRGVTGAVSSDAGFFLPTKKVLQSVFLLTAFAQD